MIFTKTLYRNPTEFQMRSRIKMKFKALNWVRNVYVTEILMRIFL